MDIDLGTFSPLMWAVAVLAALGIGLAKGGMGGVAMITLVLFASIIDPKVSVGVVLPLLIVGDVLAVWYFRKSAQISHVWRLLPPTLVGVVIGWKMLEAIPAWVFGPVIGTLILMLVGLQLWRGNREKRRVARLPQDSQLPDPPAVAAQLPPSRWFGWSMGALAGIATMLANAAGPVMTIYLLTQRLEKKEFVGTAAVFFFIVNLAKTPFSSELGILNPHTLQLNLWLAPAVIVGFFCGRWILHRMSQKVFEKWMLLGSVVGAVLLLFRR